MQARRAMDPESPPSGALGRAFQLVRVPRQSTVVVLTPEYGCDG